MDTGYLLFVLRSILNKSVLIEKLIICSARRRVILLQIVRTGHAIAITYCGEHGHSELSCNTKQADEIVQRCSQDNWLITGKVLKKKDYPKPDENNSMMSMEL